MKTQDTHLQEKEHAEIDGAAVAVLEALDGCGLDPWQGAVALAESLATHLQVTVPASEQRDWLRKLVAMMEMNLTPAPPVLEVPRWAWN